MATTVVMQKVILKTIHHKGQNCVGIYYARDYLLNQLLTKEVKATWSNSHKCWYFIYDENMYNHLLSMFKLHHIKVENELTFGYQLRKKALTILPNLPSTVNKSIDKKSGFNTIVEPINMHVLKAMKEHLIVKAYSQSTIRTYINEMQQLLYRLGKIPADELKPAHLKRYFVYCFETLQLSENTLHSRMNAIKFYYEQVLHQERFFWEIPRPKKHLQLPRFFTQDEVASIIKSIKNVKHKTLLMLCYATGMRVSEVVNLKTANIMSDRKCILIEKAKGKKDRIVPLSPILLVMLREYATQYPINKKGYLFEGQEPGQPYSTRSLQMILQDAKVKAGIFKPGAIHAMRHSFATHLLDKGTDISMIQKLLGHNDIKTTLRYLHTTNKDLINIISPLDDLNL